MMLFAQKGIRAVRMDDIAAHLSISKRTLYEIYACKEDLLFEGIKEYHVQRREEMALKAQQAENVMDIIIEIYRGKVKEFNMTNPQFYADVVLYPRIVQYLENNRKATQDKFYEFIERGIQEGYFRPDVNYQLISDLFTAINDYMVSHELFRQYSMKELLNNMLLVSLRGFCTLNGVKIVDRFLADNH